MSKASPQIEIRDRIVELRRVRASELIPNERNPRRHPEPQAAAVRGLLTEVGYADALIARETPEGLKLIDGHLRQSLTPDSLVPVLVLDVDESEADKLLLALDPLTALAQYDAAQLESLLKDVETEDAALREVLEGLATENNLIAPNVEFKEYDESIEKTVEYLECPNCQHKWPK